MLDWFTGYVGYDASQLALGLFFEVDREGEIVRRRDRWETARGSFESGIQLCRASATDQMVEHSRKFGFRCASAVLQLSGNPSKFLQGHNVAGPSVSLLGPVLRAVVRAFGEGFRPADADDDGLPAVQRSRLDITTSCDLGSHEAVHDFLRHVAATGRSRHGRALDSSGTVYFGKHSRRWALKLYCKHCELAAHHPAVSAGLFADLLDFTRSHVRVELVLRRPELARRGVLDESVIWEFCKRIEVSDMVKKAEPEKALRPVVRLAFLAWHDGVDLAVLLSRATLYRYRREILAATGCDVLLPLQPQQEAAGSVLIGWEELRRREVRVFPEPIVRSLALVT